MENAKIIVIDETLREGMQYSGVMFSFEQRKKILEFQEKLGVDICQAGYPPAHPFEADIVKKLNFHAKTSGFKIRVAGMGRALPKDADILSGAGLDHFHFHVHIKNSLSDEDLDHKLSMLVSTIQSVKKRKPEAVISVAMLDIGKSEPRIIEKSIKLLGNNGADILSLPDTSGMMAPNQVFEAIKRYSAGSGSAQISIHCHNDMGMASANTVMGILAGGSVIEASALGIGERNGIADLYTTVKTLKDQGVETGVDTENIGFFKVYYEFVDAIVHDQTGEHLLDSSTPVFGDAVKTHVAGTHADGQFGITKEEKFYLNILCGKQLVQKYLDANRIDYPAGILDDLTLKIKEKSLEFNRSLHKGDIQPLIQSICSQTEVK